MDWLKEEFSKSNIISGLLAVAIWGGIIYLSVAQAPIPDILYAGGMSVIAFFFGTKVGNREGEIKAYRDLGERMSEVKRGKL